MIYSSICMKKCFEDTYIYIDIERNLADIIYIYI